LSVYKREANNMSCCCNQRRDPNEDLIRELRRFIGQTVTVFTTSGGESGRGFTGVLMSVTSDPIIRLVTSFGPAPACALGSCCDKKRCGHNFQEDDDEDDDMVQNTFECGVVRNVGAVVDIPVNRIVAFVHNTL
jgi:hypothetical protein